MTTTSAPLVSIIIATFNSQKTLPAVLNSIKKQTYNSNNIEVLLLDGGSTDQTLTIAQQFSCRVIPNPKTEPVFAKYLGYCQAKGKYILYLDHDEVLENKKSIENKVAIFQFNNNVKAVISTGYKNPRNYAAINNYINEFGDPFSFFIYRLSKDARFFIPSMRKYPIAQEDTTSVVFNFSHVDSLPIIELCAAASMVDAVYMKTAFPETLKKPELIPHFFYLLIAKGNLIAIAKNDALYHYSSDNLGKYLNKIRWRIKNNIYHTKDMGVAGFIGRQKYLSRNNKLKKYFFIPYCYLLIPLLFDTIVLVLTRKKWIYVLHLPLSLFTANLIVYHYAMKLLGSTQRLKSYDESREVVR